MIDCDQVFDVLTRGPFPTGAAIDDSVELHLAVCPECARLAAALRPALELFQEAVGPDEGRDLPSYWGEVAVEASERASICTDTHDEDEEEEPRRTRRPLTYYSQKMRELTSLNVWRVAAAVAFGVFVGSVFHSFAPGGPAAKPPEVAHATPVPAGPLAVAFANRHDHSTRVPVACALRPGGRGDFEPLTNPVWVNRRFDELNCCTHCHNATRAVAAPSTATAAVQESCRYCHSN